MSGPAYDAERGGAIWNQRMSSDDGEFVASWMVQVLREQAQGVEHPDGWQVETINRSFDGGDWVWRAVGHNVLIEMYEDFQAQVAEAKARGEDVPTVSAPCSTCTDGTPADAPRCDWCTTRGDS